MTRAVVFAYHDVGVTCLATLLDFGIEVPLVVTHTDDPRETLWFASVAQLAQARGIDCIAPDDANAPEVVARVAATRPDFLFSFYYRRMLGAPLLAVPARGAYNMHGSLLPRYRGRAPVNWAIIHGEAETGATLHAMNEKPDNGAIVAQEAVPIGPDDTAAEVMQGVAAAAGRVLAGALPGLVAGTAPHRPQDLRQGAYFGGRRPEDGRIDFAWGAARIHDFVRALTRPYPGAFADLAGHRVTLWRTRRLAMTHAGPGASFRAGDALRLFCADGAVLEVSDCECDGRPLSTADFAALFGGAVLPLA